MSLLDVANQRKKERNLKWPKAIYKVLLAKFLYKRSGKGNNMFELELNPVDWPEEHSEDVNTLLNKNRIMKYCFVFSPNNDGFADFLLFLQDLGVDLSGCRDIVEDPNHEDLKAVMRKVVRTPPELTIDLSWKNADDKYPVIKILDVPKIFTSADFQTGSSVPPKLSPKTKEIEPTLYYEKDGEPVEVTSKEMDRIVLGGYTGEVCIDGENWISLDEAGFVVPAPKKKAPPKRKTVAAPEPEPEQEEAPTLEDDDEFPDMD